MVVSAKVAAQISAATEASDKPAALLDVINKIKDISSPVTFADDLIAISDCVFDNSIGIVGSRAVLDAIITSLKSFEDFDVWLKVGRRLLVRLRGGSGDGSDADGGASAVSTVVDATMAAQFQEQVAALCDLVASALENDEQFVEAARLLATIPLDSSQRRVSETDKAQVWVRIVRDYLEVDDSTLAETYLNKAKNVILDVEDEVLNVHFKLSQARIYDAKREFLAASGIYLDLSFSLLIAEEERLRTLSTAIKCAILAPAGPSRSRMLGRLYKDDRMTLASQGVSGGGESDTGTGTGTIGLTIDPNEYSILEKMYLHRLITPAEVDKFAQSLPPHQLATTADGSTVLARAVLEHNLLGVSRLYNNIAFTRLARLLGLDNTSKAEETTARMIEQGRLVGRIDQIEGRIWFESGEGSDAKGSGRTESAVDTEMRQWDANVQSLAEDVESISNTLQQKHPEFYARHMMA